MASRLQKAMQERRVGKAYLAILTGELRRRRPVDQPLGDDTASPVFMKSAVRADGQASVTRFEPLSAAGGFTLARVVTETGRKHQIRAHAQWLGHSIVGRQDLRARRPPLPGLHRRGLDARRSRRASCSRARRSTAPGSTCAAAGLPFAFEAPLPRGHARLLRAARPAPPLGRIRPSSWTGGSRRARAARSAAIRVSIGRADGLSIV